MTPLAAAPDDLVPDLRRLVPEVEVVGLDERRDEVTFLVPASAVTRDLSAWPALQVVQTLSAGTDWLEGAVPDGVVLCNARGARDAIVAEWTVAALLGLTSGLLAAARSTSWSPAVLEELGEQEVLVLGAGSIARAVAERLRPLGTRVRLTGREARDGVERTDDVLADLGGVDHLVVLLPGGGATEGLVDAAVLGRLRDGASVVNVGRGSVVHTDALTAELATGRLRAVLDVVDPEPLPDAHPLWRAAGLLALSSHSAGDSPQADARALQLAADQLRRHARGEELVNVVEA